jgi:protein tyrosine/serine phosphatase
MHSFAVMKNMTWIKLITGFMICFAFLSTAFSLDRLQNVDVENQIWRGSQPLNTADYDQLTQLGVKTIISLRWEKEVIAESRKQAEARGIEFVNIPFKANVGPSEEQLRQIFSIFENTAQKPVYLHCIFGKDRTGLIFALYRVKKQGWTKEAAYEEWLKFGFASKVPSLAILKEVFYKYSEQDFMIPSPNRCDKIF